MTAPRVTHLVEVLPRRGSGRQTMRFEVVAYVEAPGRRIRLAWRDGRWVPLAELAPTGAVRFRELTTPHELDPAQGQAWTALVTKAAAVASTRAGGPVPRRRRRVVAPP